MDKTRVLIIDDNEDMCRDLKSILEDENYSVCATGCGRKGMKLVAEESPAIILLDLKVPGIDGYKILKRIKKERPNAKVVVMTGAPVKGAVSKHPDERVRKFLRNDARDAESLRLADEIFVKPFNVEKLISKIDELTQKMIKESERSGN